MRTQTASLADVIGRAKAILNGMGENEADMKSIGLDSATLTALLDKFILQDGKQEKLKGDMHEATDELYSTKKVLKDQLSRIVSMLEGKYGKSNPKLQDFGVAPRHINPHKGPRVKAKPGTHTSNSAPASNYPANGTSPNYNPANGTPANYNPANSPANNPPQPSVAA